MPLNQANRRPETTKNAHLHYLPKTNNFSPPASRKDIASPNRTKMRCSSSNQLSKAKSKKSGIDFVFVGDKNIRDKSRRKVRESAPLLLNNLIIASSSPHNEDDIVNLHTHN